MPAGSAGTGLAGIPHGKIFRTGYNWFTGDGMVHGVRLGDGQALWYRNRWVDSEATSATLQRLAPSERGRSPLHGPSANTNVIGFTGKTLALVEGGLACVELSEELDTVDVCDFDGTVRGGYTAHPSGDPETGELHAVSYHFGRGNTVQYNVIGADGHLRKKIPIRVGGSPMMHAFSLSRDYVVVYDLPVTFDVRSAVAANVARPLHPLGGIGLRTDRDRGVAATRDFDPRSAIGEFVFHPASSVCAEAGFHGNWIPTATHTP